MCHQEALKILVEDLTAQGIDVDNVKHQLRNQKIELPSWGFGDSGTRFQIFRQQGIPRNLYEKLDDVAAIPGVPNNSLFRLIGERVVP